MFRHRLLPALVVASCAALAIEDPAQTSAKHNAILREGIALHNQGQYDAAIVKYKEVLKEAPDHAVALYEISYAYFAKGDAQQCMEYAKQGLTQRSAAEGALYATLGSCQDIAGLRDEAIETLKKGIRQVPGHPMLHFNLGITYERSGQLDKARSALAESVRLQPMHPGSHLGLARIYSGRGYRIPALMAALTFLLLEPQSGRSPAALQIVEKSLSGLVSQRSPGSRDVNVTLPAKAPEDEGDYMSAELMLAMGLAPVGKEASETAFQRIAGAIDTLGSSLASVTCKGKAFACRHYAPFFAKLSSDELASAMLSRALKAATVAGKDEWTRENAPKLAEFDSFLTGYKWSTVK